MSSLELKKMIENKFRAWDKRRKIMYYPDNEIALTRISANGDFAEIEDKGEVIEMNIPEELILMQYINRKDKNNDEIYEEDIIKIGNYLPIHAKVVYSKSLNKYHAEYFVMVQYRGEDKKTRQITFADIDSEYEIIGNIYEDPHLFEKQKP